MRKEVKDKIDLWVLYITSLVGLPYVILITIGLWSFEKIKIMEEFVLAIVICEVVIYTIRYFYFRPRPIGKTENFTSLFERLDESSFPSIHAARAGIFAVILSQMIPMKAKILLWIMSGAVCVSRIYLKRHHPSDVIVGGILGLIISYFIIVVGGPI